MFQNNLHVSKHTTSHLQLILYNGMHAVYHHVCHAYYILRYMSYICYKGKCTTCRGEYPSTHIYIYIYIILGNYNDISVFRVSGLGVWDFGLVCFKGLRAYTKIYRDMSV